MKLIRLVGARLFLLEVDDIALTQREIFGYLVEPEQIFHFEAKLLRNAGEAIPVDSLHIDQPMCDVWLMCPCHLCCLLPAPFVTFAAAHTFAVFLIIETIELIVFNQLDQLVGISPVGGITRFLQPSGPALVIGDSKRKERAVASAVDQKQGVILIGVLHTGILTETIVRRIIGSKDRRSFPTTVAFYAEVIVGASSQVAQPGSRLQYPLRQGDGCRDPVTLHMRYCQIAVILSICFIGTHSGLPVEIHRDK